MRNHFWDEEYEVSEGCVEFINKLDGKTNPMKILMTEGMTRREAKSFISQLEENGLIRSSKKIPYGVGMRSLILVDKSYKYKEISTVLLFLHLMGFLPAIYTIFHYFILDIRHIYFYGAGVWQMWIGIILGALIGMLFHELYHAISCIAFTPEGEKSVLEFGLSFRGFPGAYTLMDTSFVSKTGRIITNLAGVISNFIIAALCSYLTTVSYDFGAVFFYMCISNIELGLVNCLFVETLDGRQAIDEIIGIYSDCKKISFKRYERANYVGREDNELNLYTSRIFMATKIIYPALLIFNIAIFLGW